MGSFPRSLTKALLVSLLMATFSAVAQSQSDWPRQPIKIVVGFAPGGGNDFVSRTFGQKLGELLGQPVMIENRPGANGFIAAEIVAANVWMRSFENGPLEWLWKSLAYERREPFRKSSSVPATPVPSPL